MSCPCVLRPERVLGGEPGPVLRRLLLEPLFTFETSLLCPPLFSHVAAPGKETSRPGLSTHLRPEDEKPAVFRPRPEKSQYGPTLKETAAPESLNLRLNRFNTTLNHHPHRISDTHQQ